MPISYVINLLLVMSFVQSFPTIERTKGCSDMPSSDYSTDTEDFSAQEIIDDIKSFISNYSQRFTEMNLFINEHKNNTRYLDIKYFLYTPMNLRSPYSLRPTEESLSGSNFNPSSPTTVIVHGYSTVVDLNNSTCSVMKDYLLQRSPANVIIMDYTKYCQGPYTEAVKYSYLVALNLVHFAQFIAEHSFAPIEQFHFIGISLGAQVSGNAGLLIPNLGRITGLDPAGPLFELFPTDYRLSSESALFVDVIHTGASSFPFGMGIPQPVGDVDFYPNGGKYQPGCNATENVTSNTSIGIEMVNAIHCSHRRAVFLFLESFCNDECQFIGISCKNYEDFQNGACTEWNSAISTMGINAEWQEDAAPETQFHLDTNSKFPFCIN